jgi:hypothetical protein
VARSEYPCHVSAPLLSYAAVMDPQPFDHDGGGPGALAGLEALEHRLAPAPTAAPLSERPRPVARTSEKIRAIRRTGPFVALLLPAAFGLISFVMLRDSTTTTRGVGGFVLALLAAPLLPAFGVPLRTGSGAVLGAAAASAILWLFLGALAAQRATRSPTAGWGRFWAEYLWLCLCAWVGSLLAVAAANLVLGRVLL